VLSLHFFAGEPVLMSSGGDNAVKQWIFDAEDGSARLLRFRSGHAAPPVCVRFYGEGRRLLSAGADRAFRVFSTIQDQQSRELSQRNVAHRAKKLRCAEEELKLPPVAAVAACQLRERDWCNVVTAHAAAPAAYAWRLVDGALGEHVLTPPRSGGAPVTAVAVSACGHYALLGTASGDVDRFNLQSGLHRGGFVRRAGEGGEQGAAPAVAKPVKPGKALPLWQMAGPKRETDDGAAAHGGGVTVVDADACNAHVVSAGLDGALRLWGFKSRRLLSSVPVGAAVERGALHRGAALLALACADRSARVFDVAAAPPRRVRVFSGHGDAVTDLAFAADARWLLTASLDGALRVWDVPAGRLLQALRLGGAPVTALALSPDMDMLATAHAGKRCVSLNAAWAQRSARTAPVNPTARVATAKSAHCARCFRRGAQHSRGSFADTARGGAPMRPVAPHGRYSDSSSPHISFPGVAHAPHCAQGHLPVGQPAGVLRLGRG
jgi:U3 small nucleolar RNA-associated protein 21